MLRRTDTGNWSQHRDWSRGRGRKYSQRTPAWSYLWHTTHTHTHVCLILLVRTFIRIINATFKSNPNMNLSNQKENKKTSIKTAVFVKLLNVVSYLMLKLKMIFYSLPTQNTNIKMFSKFTVWHWKLFSIFFN